MPERKKVFTILTNDYDVEFPSTGGLIEVEIIKAQLSRNQYSALNDGGTVQSSYSKALIDMIATFNVLFPKLRKDMNVQSISELQAIDSKKLLTIYIKEVLPWLNEWFNVLNTDDDIVEDEKK